MRFLVVGAGAVGGYFGARLVESGADVTFLVRPGRAAQLRKAGLNVRSTHGDVSLTAPQHVMSADISGPYDVIIVGCKAYDLPATMESFAPAVGERTAIVPLLNGMRHLTLLGERFGDARVLGGLCMISATLDAAGTILHVNDLHTLVLGDRDGSQSARVAGIGRVLARAKFETQVSAAILQEMWEKWIFIAAVGGINVLMRASIGDIVAVGVSDLGTHLYAECAAIATHHGFPPRDAVRERAQGVLTAQGSPLTASLLRDMERGAPTESEHILGDLLESGAGMLDARSVLRIATAHARAYEVRRARKGTSA
ncbi:MAG: ketopantoate reductase family protein [Gemmatimonadaceae bacterium]